MKTVNSDERLIANMHTAEFTPWKLADGSDSGQSVLQLNKQKPNGVGFHLFKMEPGTTTESHEHTEDEEFFLLSGDLVDNDGTVYQVGDLVWMKKGTQHHSYSRNGCVLVVYIARAEEMVSA